MKTIKFISLFLLSCTFLACPKDERKEIIIINKSQKDISFGTVVGNSDNFWNIFWNCEGPGIKYLQRVLADSSFELGGGRHDTWTSTLSGGKILTIFFVDFITYNKYAPDCEAIRENVPIFHYYQLTLDDLKQMNWTIVVPPESQ
jgi:hypothetical protein